MHTSITTKLAALAVAMLMNSLIIGGVAYLFNNQSRQHVTLTSQVHAPAAALNGVI